MPPAAAFYFSRCHTQTSSVHLPAKRHNQLSFDPVANHDWDVCLKYLQRALDWFVARIANL